MNCIPFNKTKCFVKCFEQCGADITEVEIMCINFNLIVSPLFVTGLGNLKAQVTPRMLVSSGPSECFVAGVYILIAAGALMMVVGFLGCCGAIKESPCMLGLVSDFFCVLVLHITLKTGDFAVNHEFMLRFFSWHISEMFGL